MHVAATLRRAVFAQPDIDQTKVLNADTYILKIKNYLPTILVVNQFIQSCNASLTRIVQHAPMWVIKQHGAKQQEATERVDAIRNAKRE